MNDYLPSEQIQEGLRGFLEILPFVYVLMVIITVIAFGIVKFNGDTIKNYKIYVLLIGLCFAGITYLFYPSEEVKIRDIPTLIVGCISSLFFLQLFIYWRKRKSNEKRK